MITDRDKDIIDFIDNIGFATIKNINDMYFTNCRYGYDLARKRLRKICECNKYIRGFRNSETNEIVYVPKDSKIKRVSIHNIMVLEYICKLKGLGCNITTVEIEPNFNNIIPDAFIEFIFDGYKYYQLLEIQIRHDFVDLKRYRNIQVINSVLEKSSGVLPRIIIVQDTNKDYESDNPCQFKIIQMRTNMNDISKCLI